MDANHKWDRNFLMNMPKEKLIDLLLVQIRNIWSEDGLYFLNIEQRFGTEAAIEIDCEVWAVMGKIEARRLKEALKITNNNIQSLFEVLKHTSWWLSLDDKEFILENNRLVIRNTNCQVQQIRIKKGLGEFSCKPVRWGFMRNFVKEFNSDIEVNCLVCPPDEHPEDLYCEWEFILK